MANQQSHVWLFIHPAISSLSGIRMVQSLFGLWKMTKNPYLSELWIPPMLTLTLWKHSLICQHANRSSSFLGAASQIHLIHEVETRRLPSLVALIQQILLD